jgi:uncharacterized protein
LSGDRHLVDVNVLVARVFEDHTHHNIAKGWFGTPGLQWAICALTEAGFLRYAATPDLGGISVGEATATLERLSEHPGYEYRPLSDDWRTLTQPFFKRLHGHRQITDAYLLGLALREGMVLVTFDKAILHLAGEYSHRVRVLGDWAA